MPRRFRLDSPLALADGYGSAGIGIMRALDAAGVWFEVSVQPGARSPLCQRDQDLVNKHASGVSYVEIGVPITSADRWYLCGVAPRVGVTMWETSKFPPEFAGVLRREHGNIGILTPTVGSLNALRAGGVDLPIEVVPLGVDPADWFVDPSVQKFEQFTFVLAGQLSYRKGTDIAIRAFQEEFRSGEPVGFILKTTSFWGPDFAISDPRIHVHTGEWSVEELRRLFNQSHRYVAPSRGEGFGLVPLQAMACGIPAIVNALPNAAAYFTWPEVDAVPPAGTENAADFWWHRQLGITNCGEFWTPSVDGFRVAMRKAYEMNREALRALGLRASARAHSEMSWGNMVQPFLSALDRLGG